jgi:hypothetical protein
MFTLIDLETRETVKLDAPDDEPLQGSDPGLWETEQEAWAYALARFVTQASKRFDVIALGDT